MPGRRIPSESELLGNEYGFSSPGAAQRHLVLRDTLRAFGDADPPERYTVLAMDNLRRWRDERDDPGFRTEVMVLPGDWGEVTRSLTKRYGACFAVLNMANV